MTMRSINPATEQVIASHEPLTDAELNQALARAAEAFRAWRETTFEQRAGRMRTVADLLREQRAELGMIMTREMGKPITQASSEIEKCAWTCEYFADNAKKFLSPEPIASDASGSYVQFDPLGVVLAVMPWNFPLWQVFRFAAPALMAGNVGVLKHASNVQQCAQVIEKLFLEAGFPAGVFQNLAIESSRIEKVIMDPRIAAVTLTGSEGAGVSVAQTAGRALKKTVLELGGSDPFIVLDDADVEAAAAVGALARLQNNGQSCIAAKRFIVTRAVADQFLKAFKKAFEQMVVGDPLKPETTVGPLVNQPARETIIKQVTESVKRGAKVVIGGTQLEGHGYFFAPTILANVQKGMPVYDEEVFGPVAAVITVADAAEAILVANDTQYGLGASLWTRDEQQGRNLANQINAGAVFINGMVKSDPRLPFGGIKRSGYGRELSHYGIREFVNIKTVWQK